MSSPNSIAKRSHVHSAGAGDLTLLFAHGFGCDQNMWRFVAPRFEASCRVVMFDYVGSGHSDLSAYVPQRYRHLQGYAQDIQEICVDLKLQDVVLVEHSVSCMIGLLASLAMPERVRAHIMLGPSPCFLNHPPDYAGGFERSDLEELLNLMDKNYIGWAHHLAPIVMGLQETEPLSGELAESFCSTDPVVAKAFARATFMSDCRELLPQALHPALILQSEVDSLASIEVGRYVHEHMPGSEMQILPARGHCAHMTDPDLVVAAIEAYLAKLRAPLQS